MCFSRVMMSLSLLLGNGHFCPLPLGSAVITWLRESPNLTTPKVPRQATHSPITLSFTFFPGRCFLFVGLFIYLSCYPWWFFLWRSISRPMADIRRVTSVVWYFSHLTHDAFPVLHTGWQNPLPLAYLLFMVLSNICKSLGLESAFLPRIIGKVWDLCCLCPSWPDVVCILEQRWEMWLTLPTKAVINIHSNSVHWDKHRHICGEAFYWQYWLQARQWRDLLIHEKKCI